MPPQDEIPRNGYAIQCRITTEDPENKFTPDYGKILTYRSRRRLRHPARRRHGLRRRGHHAVLRFAAGEGHRVAARPSTMALRPHGPRAARVPHPRREDEHSVPRKRHSQRDVPHRPGDDDADRHDAGAVHVQAAPRPRHEAAHLPRRRHRQRQSAREGLRTPKQRLPARARSPAYDHTANAAARARASCCSNSARRNSPSGRCKQKRLLITDTTFRDAHQSLMATRVRTLRHAGGRPTPSPAARRICSPSRCGAARRSTPRCASCTRIRGNACASCARRFRTSASRCSSAARTPSATRTIPDNVVAGFVKHAAGAGMDIFRIFDSLNYSAEPEGGDGGRAGNARDLRGGHLLHRRHPRSEARQVLAEVLREAREGTGEDGRAHPRHQGHGRPVPSLRRAASW